MNDVTANLRKLGELERAERNRINLDKARKKFATRKREELRRLRIEAGRSADGKN